MCFNNFLLKTSCELLFDVTRKTNTTLLKASIKVDSVGVANRLLWGQTDLYFKGWVWPHLSTCLAGSSHKKFLIFAGKLLQLINNLLFTDGNTIIYFHEENSIIDFSSQYHCNTKFNIPASRYATWNGYRLSKKKVNIFYQLRNYSP